MPPEALRHAECAAKIPRCRWPIRSWICTPSSTFLTFSLLVSLNCTILYGRGKQRSLIIHRHVDLSAVLKQIHWYPDHLRYNSPKSTAQTPSCSQVPLYPIDQTISKTKALLPSSCLLLSPAILQEPIANDPAITIDTPQRTGYVIQRPI